MDIRPHSGAFFFMRKHYSSGIARDKLELLASIIKRFPNPDSVSEGTLKIQGKANRGLNAVLAAPDYSPLLQRFLDKIEDGKAINSHDEVHAIFEYIRKFDDGQLEKLKLTKGDEIHHLIGYSEFAQSIKGLSVDDQVKAFNWLSENDIPIGTTSPNVETGAFSKPSHRNPLAVGNPSWMSAHMKNTGMPHKLAKTPASFDEWVNAFSNEIIPKSYTGATIGRIVDGPRIQKVFDAITADPEGLEAFAKKQGVSSQDIISSVFSRSTDPTTNNSPALKAARKYARQIKLDETMKDFKQGAANQDEVFEIMKNLGFDVDAARNQLPTGTVDANILNKGNAWREVVRSPLLKPQGFDDYIKTLKINQLVNAFDNPAARRAAGVFPIFGTLAGAGFVEKNAADRDKEIEQNPDDWSLKINKKLDQLSGWSDRLTIGSGGWAGPVTEPVSLATGLTSLAIDGGRAVLKSIAHPDTVARRKALERAEKLRHPDNINARPSKGSVGWPIGGGM